MTSLGLWELQVCKGICFLFIVEGIKHQEETDNQLLWNLQILTEVLLLIKMITVLSKYYISYISCFLQIVRSNGSKILVYKKEIIKTLKLAIHLKNKEAATLAAKVLDLIAHFWYPDWVIANKGIQNKAQGKQSWHILLFPLGVVLNCFVCDHLTRISKVGYFFALFPCHSWQYYFFVLLCIAN